MGVQACDVASSARSNGHAVQGNAVIMRPGAATPRKAQSITTPEAKITNKSVVKDRVILIDSDTLSRECCLHTLNTHFANSVQAFCAVSDWVEVASDHPAEILLYRVYGKISDEAQQNAIKLLIENSPEAPIVLICSSEDPVEVSQAFQSGMRGYILTSMPVEVAVQTLRLVMAGGTFFPTDGLLASRAATDIEAAEEQSKVELFTPRQSRVVEALCQGKPNKIIAYELNMCESTVKVHVRNIMKKLKAKNRTEVVVAVNALAKA